MTPDGYLLLVEDNPGDARLTSSLLDAAPQAGAPVLRWVQTVAQALQCLGAEPDCRAVLLDLGLPDSEGLDGLLALQAAATDCPIIVLTGDGRADLGAEAVAAGAQDFLVKGAFDAERLRRCIGFAAQRHLRSRCACRGQKAVARHPGAGVFRGR
jgi:CheY-like chemotaxis protein